MHKTFLKFTSFVLAFILLVNSPSLSATSPIESTKTENTVLDTKNLNYREIDLASRKLVLKNNQQILKTYSIGVAKSKEFLTPIGDFKILEMDDNPGWINPYKKGVKIPPGPNNPLGTRWMGFYRNNQLNQAYGMHGTNQPSSIGKFVSHGCIRMLIPDAEDLYEQVEIGTPVSVRYKRFSAQNFDGDIALTILEDPLGLTPLTEDNLKKYLMETFPKILFNYSSLNNIVQSGKLGDTRLVGRIEQTN
jgi:hypothetical protein